MNLPDGFVLEKPQNNQGMNLPEGFVLEGDNNFKPEKKLIADRYTPEQLSGKMIPQFTKGLYEGLKDVPGVSNLVDLYMKNAPNSQVMQSVMAGTPSPEGFLPSVSRMAGNIIPYQVASTPFIGASSAIPKMGKLAKLATGIGAFEGAKKIATGEPEKAPMAALSGAGMAYAGGKAFDLGGKAIQKGLSAVSDVPGKIINSLVKPLLKDFSYGKDPGRAVASEGITGNTLDELAVNISKRLGDVGNEIGNRLQAHSGKRVDLRGFLNPIDDAIIEANKSPRTNSSLITRLNNLKKDLMGVIQQKNNILQRNIVDLTPKEASAIKMEIGNLTKFTGNVSDDNLVNKALKQAYGIVKSKINTAVPELKKLNERYADLLSAKVATEYREKITSRQNLVSMSSRLLGGGLFVTGVMQGNVQMILAGASEPLIEKALSSPALKTRLAAALAKLPAEQIGQVLSKYPQLSKLPELVARTTVPSVNQLMAK